MPLLQIGMSEIPNADAGLGSGVVNVSQQMAGAVGLAALGHHRRQPVEVAARGRPRHDQRAGRAATAWRCSSRPPAWSLGLVLGPILLRTKESPEEQQEHIKENMANPEARAPGPVDAGRRPTPPAAAANIGAMTISRVELDVTLAFCDNRFTMHHGIHDYGDDRRVMRRVTLRGERPVGPADTKRLFRMP